MIAGETAVSAQHWQQAVKKELTDNILPFHMTYGRDPVHGGFYGAVLVDGTAVPHSHKGLVQCSRLLWTFARAYRLLSNAEYLKMAQDAYAYLCNTFYDAKHGGFYWLVTHNGRLADTHKYIYGQAFAIYGLSEYAHATGDKQALAKAINLYHLLEEKATDSQWGGYWEVFTVDWKRNPALAVDDVMQPTSKSMNTHLHLLEAYTNLYHVWSNKQLAQQLRKLITLTIQHIITPRTYHFKLHFDDQWHSLTPHISYGHDIEGSWLLWETAVTLNDHTLQQTIKPIILGMAKATLTKGIDSDGGLLSEVKRHGNQHIIIDHNKDWWPQAEGMVGFYNAYQLTQNQTFLHAAFNCWQFAQAQLIDTQYGEWHWSTERLPEKLNIWKTPYHNGRACMEMMERLTPSIIM